MIIFYQ